MRILFDEISERKTEYEFTNPGWLDISKMRLTKPVEAKIVLHREDKQTVVMTGTICSESKFSCDKCGGNFFHPLKADFYYSFKHGEDSLLQKQDIECDEEDCNTEYLKNPVLEISEVLREQILLSVPERRVCKESCKGLCSRCGVDLNISSCECSAGNPNSPFAVLKQLKS